ncbi:hypothetical protein ACRRTK_005629 [Alexandromys fortis]
MYGRSWSKAFVLEQPIFVKNEMYAVMICIRWFFVFIAILKIATLIFLQSE